MYKTGEDNFKELKEKWTSDEFKRRSTQNKQNRDEDPYLHTLGAEPQFERAKKLVSLYIYCLIVYIITLT